MTSRAELFRYTGLDVHADSLVGHYELDGRPFVESVSFEGVDNLQTPAVRAVGELWYLLAGLSYFKAGAPPRVDLADTPIGPKGRALLAAALTDGLGEFSLRNNLALDDVVFEGGVAVAQYRPLVDPRRVLIPFGGGIDSVVSVNSLAHDLDRALFVVSPHTGRFASLEATAAVSGLVTLRATRTLDSQILKPDPTFFQGHVPVTAMVTLLASVAAIASGRGGVVMSNEHSSSVPNLVWRERPVNHQWSKSWVAEELIAGALLERVGPEFVAASLLRSRSELWVAREFSQLREYHHVFRSCNRAFTQDSSARALDWCGECDKCLFIDLVLAPFLSRDALCDIFHAEPLADPARESQLRALVGVGLDHTPFECVGDPNESAVALARVVELGQWNDAAHLTMISRSASPDRSFDELMTPEGPNRVPAHWLR